MVAGTSSEVAADGDKDRLSPKMLIKGNSELPLSVNAVVSNYDLLVEILLRLPVLSLLLFKSVSKHWLRIITTPDFIFRHRNENTNLDAPFGLLIRSPFGLLTEYNFESFDNRIPSKELIDFTLGSEVPYGRVEILQSCNGLLLCCTNSFKYYVYNPTSKLFRRLPTKSHGSIVRLAFDPTKSPHYKVVQLVRLQNDDDDDDEDEDSTIQVHMYSSETGVWSVCGDQFSETCFEGFKEGVYWNVAFHWLNLINLFKEKTVHYKLDIGNEQLVLTELELPVTFDGKSHFQSKLFESRGRLLLLGKDHSHSQQLNVFEMRDDSSKWSVKFIVNLDDIKMPINLDDIKMPLPRTWRICPCVWSIVLGEREEDSFMIIDVLTKVVQYYPVLKTVCTLADLKSTGSPLVVSNFVVQCIASFAEV